MNKLDRTSFSIMVVDDDPDILRGTTRILDRAGYATATADSGEAALQVMNMQKPSLVLLDWDMPGMDGIEVCKRIKGNPAFNDSLVIMISAIHTESEEQAAGLESGADGYISRPISNRELVARVESFARIWDLHHSLRESEARVRSMLHATPIGLGMSLDRVFTEVNEAVVRMTGYRRDELIGQSERMLFASDVEFERANLQTQAQINGQGIGTVETRWRRKDGEIREIYISSAPTDPDDAAKGITFSAQDTTARKAIELQMENLAFYDPLTKLPNRRLLLDRLQSTVTNSVRRQRQSALLFIDLDEFKRLNDTAGHASGDLLLKQVAKRLRSCVRDSDTVARLGGDEFVLLLDGLSAVTTEAAAQALRVGQKILTALGQPYQLDTFEHRCTASIGIKLLDAEPNQAWDEALQHADEAMYQAKASGGNSLCLFEPHSNSESITKQNG